jgi:hypothetical protein
MTARAELSSLSTGLEDLVGRVIRITEELEGPDRDELGPGLYEVERAMQVALRRLQQVLDGRAP